jgi:N-methylhydantoinase A
MTTQEIPREAFWGSKKTVFEGQGYVTPVVRRDKLLPGNSFAGPAIVIEYSSTIVVPPLSQVTIDGLHNVILEPRVYQDTERIDDVQRN